MEAQVITTVRLMRQSGETHVEMVGILNVFRYSPNGKVRLVPADEKVEMPLWAWKPAG